MKGLNTIRNFILSRKGNSLLLATASAITATVGIYFFVFITSLSEDNKQRVTHLYNAYQMGISVQEKISGKDLKRNYFNPKRKKFLKQKQLHRRLNDSLHNGNFITLQDMIDLSLIVDAPDPTASAENSTESSYDLTNSGMLIIYLDIDGNEVTNDQTRVHNVSLFVNLAGNTYENRNAPYYDGDPFYYILMDPSQDATSGYQTTIDVQTKHITGILSNVDNGPQAETSVLLPQDND